MGPQDRRHQSKAPQYKQCRIEYCWSARAATDMSPGGSQMGTTCHGCLAELSQRRRPAFGCKIAISTRGNFGALSVKAHMLIGSWSVPARAGQQGLPREPQFKVGFNGLSGLVLNWMLSQTCLIASWISSSPVLLNVLVSC